MKCVPKTVMVFATTRLEYVSMDVLLVFLVKNVTRLALVTAKTTNVTRTLDSVTQSVLQAIMVKPVHTIVPNIAQAIYAIRILAVAFKGAMVVSGDLNVANLVKQTAKTVSAISLMESVSMDVKRDILG